ncbi:unknown [Bacteroides faecis CAG:32]|nr:unknown [Bacteroides faecis CAG:32]
MALDGIRCHQMSYEGLERMLKQQEKRMKRSMKSRSKSMAKPPDYADRRELKSLYYSKHLIYKRMALDVIRCHQMSYEG